MSLGGKAMQSARKSRSWFLSLAFILAAASPLAAQSSAGRIAGVVYDPSGVPQMGATVIVVAQSMISDQSFQLLTDAHGRFVSPTLNPGLYSIRVTLAGFLPVLQPRVEVNEQETTNLQIELGSVFSGLSTLRQSPNAHADDAEWGWVLRTSAATRPVLRWQDGRTLVVENQNAIGESSSRNHVWRSRIDLTSGLRPASANSFSDSPATSFAYDQGVGATGQLLIAGQFSYESAAPSGGFATIWLPKGNAKSGPVSSVVIRQSRLGPQGPEFRGLSLDQDGVIQVSDRVTIRYGAQYLLAGLDGAMASGVRPRSEVAVQLSKNWQTELLLASRPWPQSSPEAAAPLESALDSLDAFPTMLFRNGRPVIQNGWHEELDVDHNLNKNAKVMLAAFHDSSDDTAVFGQGTAANSGDFLQDFFSNGFAYDAGNSGSWGTRVAYQQKLSDNFSTTVVYAWAGALTPLAAYAPNESLREDLSTRYHHSVAGSISSQIPFLKTKIVSGYKWIDGPVVSRQDEFGEAFYNLDPYMNLVIHQPIPCGFAHNHLEAVADFGNLLAQGYVPITTRDGHVVMVAAYRTFRGGISLQF
jgi:Carboxypeptidase regulatory-like domain